MARKMHHSFDEHLPVNPDPLDYAVGTAGEWSLPSTEGLSGQLVGQSPTMLRNVPMPSGNNLAEGIFVGESNDADAIASWPPLEHLISAQIDAPMSYQAPHEATHRRYEPTLRVSVAQTAAGFTLLAAPNQGLHYVKLIAAHFTLSAAGTIKFVQGSTDGTVTADLSGAMSFGGAAASPLVLAPSELANPWLLTTPDLALGIVTTTGLASGWAVYCYSPYDS